MFSCYFNKAADLFLGFFVVFDFFVFRVSWPAQYFVDLEVQISWQAQYFVEFEVQILRQALYFVDLEVQISW